MRRLIMLMDTRERRGINEKWKTIRGEASLFMEIQLFDCNAIAMQL